MRLFQNASYEFLETRRRAYLFSAALIAAGLISIALHQGLDFGVDFTGGTLFQVHFPSATSVADVRSAVSTAGLTGAAIQRFGGTDEFLVRVAAFGEEGGEDVGARIQRALTGRFGESGYEVVRTEAVGPKVGGELKTKAIFALAMSFALTLIYLAFRFEWRFGVAAIVATLHDILVTFGFLSIFSVEISLATVAAILTIIGYSLNDTIVVFDRIRENLKKRRKDRYTDIVNSSINETLPRTVLTSGTTLVTLVALFILGGPVIRPFALVLILGVLIGTFSSIWVASPVLLEIELRSGTKERRRAA
ncbi:MAG: protein translocase subunit SecF [Gemmatimonadota bacterium]